MSNSGVPILKYSVPCPSFRRHQYLGALVTPKAKIYQAFSSSRVIQYLLRSRAHKPRTSWENGVCLMSQCVYYTEDSTHLAPETRRRASTDCRGFVPNPNLNMIPSLFFGKYIKAHFGNIADDRQLEAPLTEHLGRPRDPYLNKHKQEPWKVSTAATKLCCNRRISFLATSPFLPCQTAICYMIMREQTNRTKDHSGRSRVPNLSLIMLR